MVTAWRGLGWAGCAEVNRPGCIRAARGHSVGDNLGRGVACDGVQRRETWLT